MSKRTDRLEVVPVDETSALPLSLRRHFVRRIDGHNGQTEWAAQSYATRYSATRAAKKAAKPEGLPVLVLDAYGYTRHYIPGGAA